MNECVRGVLAVKGKKQLPKVDGAWGYIKIRNKKANVATRGQEVLHASVCTWRPYKSLCRQLPAGFGIGMKCLTQPDGIRRFAPDIPTQTFIGLASIGGLAILDRAGSLNPETRSSYNVMRLLYAQSDRSREHFARSFIREEDLLIRTSTESDPSNTGDLLPKTLGTINGRGQRWSRLEFFDHGRRKAIETGFETPTEEQIIAGGLFASACLNPLDPQTINESETRWLVRTALFDLGPCNGALDEDTKAIVYARIVKAIEKHQGHDDDSFRNWFYVQRDNLIHALANQTEGRHLSREDIRACLLEFVVDSYFYAGQCVSIQMQTFIKALPVTLTAEENAQFQSIYLIQSYLAGLPLIMMLKRFSALRPAILDLMNAPLDTRKIGTLLRLMEYYGGMAARRREVDRTVKQKSVYRKSIDVDVNTLPLESRSNDSPQLNQELFDKIADAVRIQKAIKCDCKAPGNWNYALGADSSDVVFGIDVVCRFCQMQSRIEIAREDFQKIGSEVLNSDEND